MKNIHPFPARMAPDAIAHLVDKLPIDATILDPMCGSGVVLRVALTSGRRALGFDIDPLSVLMSKVWTRTKSVATAQKRAEEIAEKAAAMPMSGIKLPWIDRCSETRDFINFWFANRQRRDLRRLSARLFYNLDSLDTHIRDCLWLALSRTIVTKQVGATLAWDVSHSRPHKKRTDNNFDVLENFVRAASQISNFMSEDRLGLSGRVKRGDCRSLPLKHTVRVDAVITSPS